MCLILLGFDFGMVSALYPYESEDYKMKTYYQPELTKLMNGEWCSIPKLILGEVSEDEFSNRWDELNSLGYLGARSMYFDLENGQFNTEKKGIFVTTSCMQMQRVKPASCKCGASIPYLFHSDTHCEWCFRKGCEK